MSHVFKYNVIKHRKHFVTTCVAKNSVNFVMFFRTFCVFFGGIGGEEWRIAYVIRAKFAIQQFAILRHFFCCSFLVFVINKTASSYVYYKSMIISKV